MTSIPKHTDSSRLPTDLNIKSELTQHGPEIAVASLAEMQAEIIQKTAQLNNAREIFQRNSKLEKDHKRAELERQLSRAEESICQSQAKRRDLQSTISQHDTLLNSLISEESSLSKQVI